MQRLAGDRFRDRIESSSPTVALGGYEALTASLADRARARVAYTNRTCPATPVHSEPYVALTPVNETIGRSRVKIRPFRERYEQ